MSASDKKKLRKEQTAAAMTEKQQAEKKQQKKLKAYTLTFAIIMVLVVAIVLCSSLATPINRMIINGTNAVTVNDHKISATELNYFYVDGMSSIYNQYSSYGDYQYLYCYMSTGWNPSTPVGEQTYDTETGETWADYFIDAAVESAKWTYGMYDKAMAEGFELTEDQQSEIDMNESYLSLYASLYGYSNADGYVRAIYGSSADLDSYMEYYKVSYIASAYANAYIDSLEYTDSDYREHEADKMKEFNSYSWLSYYVNATNYREGGTTTKDENGKETTTYSDEEKAAAVEAAKADAEKLVASRVSGLEELNKAITALEKSSSTAAATQYTDQLYSTVSSYTPNEEAVEWLTSEDRVEGDMTYIAYTTTDSEGKETTNGYYVLYFSGCIDNTDVNVGNVRHLLIAFEEEDDGTVTDEAKAAAKLEAEKLLEEYKSGEMTEEAFTTLIKEHSDDTEDGLYENITPASKYVTNFKNWAVADHEVGDVEIIETEYGYHIMYYVGASDLNYRDYLIDIDITNEDYEAWEEALVETVTAELLTEKYIDTEYQMVSAS